MSTATQALLVAIRAGMAGSATILLAARSARAGEPLAASLLVRVVLVVAAALGLGLALALVLDPPGAFGVMSFLYLAAVVSVPLAAATWLVVGVRRGAWGAGTAHRASLGLALVALLLAPLGVWMSRVEPRRLHVDRVAVAAPTADGDDVVRIGVLADVQTLRIGPHERRAVRMLLDERPDVVLIAGDLFQGTPAEAVAIVEDYRDLLRDLAAVPGGAYLVAGDVDPRLDLPALVAGTGVRLLDGDVATVAVGDRRLEVLGLPLLPDEASRAALDAFATRPSDGAARLVLAHRPDWANAFGAGPAGVDLVVAGHTHGGQVQLPLIGPLMTLTDVPRHVAGGGLGTVDGQPVYVSTGVGMEHVGAPQIRLGARPSVGLVELR